MKADFKDAHNRHWDDAERLLQAQRWANADHLYGMAAECGLKRLMAHFGMAVSRATGNPVNRADWKHIDQNLWAYYETYRSGHNDGVNYVLTPPIDPFQDWDTSQRYAHHADFDEARVRPHRDGAEVVRKLLKQAERDGLI